MLLSNNAVFILSCVVVSIGVVALLGIALFYHRLVSYISRHLY